jgi:hypothetical protein
MCKEKNIFHLKKKRKKHIYRELINHKKVLGIKNVMLNMVSGNSLALNNTLHVVEIKINLVYGPL